MAIDLKEIQGAIGYRFENEDLLQQAFVRRSYSQEHGGQNNEVLEFIGDKALDLVVIRLMMDRFGQITEDKEWNEIKLRNPKYFQTKLKEGQFTDIKKDLVQKDALSNCMDKLGFHTQLIMGQGDSNNNVQDQKSVKEDLFEAIIGAVAVDSDYDMDSLTNVVETMIDFDDYFDNYDDEESNYVGLVQEFYQGEYNSLPDYEYYETYDSEYKCRLTLDGIGSFDGYGISKAKSRKDAAHKAYDYLEENGYIENAIKSSIGNLDFDQILRQYNELVQQELIDPAKFEFESDHDEVGNSLWICNLIDSVGNVYTATSNSKKFSKKICVYDYLAYLLDLPDYDETYGDDDYEDYDYYDFD